MKKTIVIMFIITIIISSILIFYNPYKKYLGVYKDTITIEYDIFDCNWAYKLTNYNLELESHNKTSEKESWIFKIKNDGIEKLVFNCLENDDEVYNIYYNLKINKNKIFWIEGEGKGVFDYPNPY